MRELKNVLRRGVALNGEGGTLEPEHLGLAGAAASPERAAVDTYHESKAQLIETWEKSYVRRVLDETGGNVSQAARKCGLGRAYLHRLIRKYRSLACARASLHPGACGPSIRSSFVVGVSSRCTVYGCRLTGSS